MARTSRAGMRRGLEAVYRPQYQVILTDFTEDCVILATKQRLGAIDFTTREYWPRKAIPNDNRPISNKVE
jgi:hypothetical protein